MPEMTLDKKSSPEAIRDWISNYIRTCIREGERPREQCIAIAYEMARKATGKQIRAGGKK